jgi:hypothetical protein
MILKWDSFMILKWDFYSVGTDIFVGLLKFNISTFLVQKLSTSCTTPSGVRSRTGTRSSVISSAFTDFTIAKHTNASSRRPPPPPPLIFLSLFFEVV